MNKELNAFYNLNNLGIIYAKQGDFNQAIACFKKAIEINPKDTEAQKNLMVIDRMKACQAYSLETNADFEEKWYTIQHNTPPHANLRATDLMKTNLTIADL